jgi:hypothetical protein
MGAGQRILIFAVAIVADLATWLAGQILIGIAGDAIGMLVTILGIALVLWEIRLLTAAASHGMAVPLIVSVAILFTVSAVGLTAWVLIGVPGRPQAAVHQAGTWILNAALVPWAARLSARWLTRRD